MPPRHSPTDETLRILTAAGDDRLVRDGRFRWTIVGEAGPLRAEREWLQRHGLLEYADSARESLLLTDAGRQLLKRAQTDRA